MSEGVAGVEGWFDSGGFDLSATRPRFMAQMTSKTASNKNRYFIPYALTRLPRQTGSLHKKAAAGQLRCTKL